MIIILLWLLPKSPTVPYTTVYARLYTVYYNAPQHTHTHTHTHTHARLYNPAVDHPVREDYPILVYKHKVKHRLCSVCSYETAQWVTEDDDLAPESPCFFCKDCFKKLHYSSDNKKLCDFKAYPYKASV